MSTNYPSIYFKYLLLPALRNAAVCPGCHRANRAQGATLNKTPIHCSRVGELRETTQTQEEHVNSTEKGPTFGIKPATFCESDSVSCEQPTQQCMLS